MEYNSSDSEDLFITRFRETLSRSDEPLSVANLLTDSLATGEIKDLSKFAELCAEIATKADKHADTVIDETRRSAEKTNVYIEKSGAERALAREMRGYVVQIALMKESTPPKDNV